MDGREGSHQTPVQADRPSPIFCCHFVCALPKRVHGICNECRAEAIQEEKHAPELLGRPGCKKEVRSGRKKASAGQNNVRIYITFATIDIIIMSYQQ